MEPNNIEKQIKEKLNQREMQPSQNAWDRLDAMLAVGEQQPKRNFKWLSIAAVFIGFTFIGIFMITKDNSNNNITPTNSIVFKKETKLIPTESTVDIENIFLEATENKAVVLQSTKKIETSSTAINPKKELLLDHYSKNESTRVESGPNESISKVIEAESLLAKMETIEKIDMPNISKKPSIKVDAATLLSSAEKEVEETFRDKVIQSINKKYNSVKSTLANRNHE